MGKIRVLHTADIHLDSVFTNLDNGKSTLRRLEQRKLLDRIIRTAENERAQIILISGDLFDSDDIYGETTDSVYNAFSSTSLPVVISPGNHDFIKPDSAYSKIRLPQNVFVFEENKLQCVELPSLKLRVWGAAFNDASSASLMDEFRSERKENWLDIICVHGEVGVKGSIYNEITEEQIAASGMHYVALGHNHKRSGLKKAGDTYYAWPGCPEGRGFDETGDKSVYVVDISDENTVLKAVDVSARKYVEDEIDIENIDEYFSKYDEVGRDLVRLTLNGEVEMKPDLSRIMNRYSEKFFYLEIVDKTHIAKDIWLNVGQDSLKGVFLGKMKEKYDSALTDDEKQKILEATQWGIAALENREGVS